MKIMSDNDDNDDSLNTSLSNNENLLGIDQNISQPVNVLSQNA